MSVTGPLPPVLPQTPAPATAPGTGVATTISTPVTMAAIPTPPAGVKLFTLELARAQAAAMRSDTAPPQQANANGSNAPRGGVFLPVSAGMAAAMPSTTSAGKSSPSKKKRGAPKSPAPTAPARK